MLNDTKLLREGGSFGEGWQGVAQPLLLILHRQSRDLVEAQGSGRRSLSG